MYIALWFDTACFIWSLTTWPFFVLYTYLVLTFLDLSNIRVWSLSCSSVSGFRTLALLALNHFSTCVVSVLWSMPYLFGLTSAFPFSFVVHSPPLLRWSCTRISSKSKLYLLFWVVLWASSLVWPNVLPIGFVLIAFSSLNLHSLYSQWLLPVFSSPLYHFHTMHLADILTWILSTVKISTSGPR